VTLEGTGSSLTNCVCNHTTSFAVIFDVNGDLADLSDASLRLLNSLSYFLCGMSAICCLLTFIALSISRSEE